MFGALLIIVAVGSTSLLAEADKKVFKNYVTSYIQL